MSKGPGSPGFERWRHLPGSTGFRVYGLDQARAVLVEPHVKMRDRFILSRNPNEMLRQIEKRLEDIYGADPR